MTEPFDVTLMLAVVNDPVNEMNVAETRREATVACPPGMLFVAGGTFRMGSDDHYKEEAPAHRVKVDGFFIDRTPVTNRQFKAFVKATGYVTVASGCLMRNDRLRVSGPRSSSNRSIHSQAKVTGQLARRKPYPAAV